MQTAVFETDNAIFYFEPSDAICHFKNYSEQKVREAIELLKTVSSSSSEVSYPTSSEICIFAGNS